MPRNQKISYEDSEPKFHGRKKKFNLKRKAEILQHISYKQNKYYFDKKKIKGVSKESLEKYNINPNISFKKHKRDTKNE